MPPVILTLLQWLFLLLLYVFVARAVRAVVRDIRAAAPAARPASGSHPSEKPAPPAAARSRRRRGAEPGQLVVHAPEGRPQVIRLDAEEVRFGRAESCTVPLQDTYVSEQHARIYRTDDGWVVADMGSTNGTFLNQRKVTQPVPIEAGDQLGIGRTVVEVRR